MAYELIETVEVGSGGAASIEFTSIPQDGTDLVLKVSGRADKASTTDSFGMRFNGDSGSNYPVVWLAGSGSSASSNGFTSNLAYLVYVTGATATSNTFSNNSAYISNYTASQNKSISVDSVTEDNQTFARQHISTSVWENTSAITSIEIISETGANFVENTTASLYKITAA